MREQKKGRMPRSPLHVLIWSADQALYELFIQGHLKQRFRPEDENLWLDLLHRTTSFAFQGHSGRLNVYKEARPRGGHYWYAYHTAARRTVKRYLGQTANVTFARLEEVANILTRSTSPEIAHANLPAVPLQSEQRMMPLLTKLVHPPVPSTLVEREHLLHRLDAALLHRLLLLSSSAGSGKTTLLSAWVVRSEALSRKIAWLTLDEADNDFTRFWVSVIMALRTRLPGLGEVALTMLHLPQLPHLLTVLTCRPLTSAGCSLV